MCNPVAIGIASIGLTAGSSIASFMGNKSAAQITADQNKEYYDANKQAAINSAMLNESQLSLRESEDLLSSAAQTDDLNKQEDARLSTAIVSAAEADVSGHSMDAVLADIQEKTGVNKTRVAMNSQMQMDQLESEKEGTIVQAQNEINTVRQTQVRQPSLLVPIFQTGAAGLQFANQNAQRNANANQSTPIPTGAGGLGNAGDD